MTDKDIPSPPPTLFPPKKKLDCTVFTVAWELSIYTYPHIVRFITLSCCSDHKDCQSLLNQVGLFRRKEEAQVNATLHKDKEIEISVNLTCI